MFGNAGDMFLIFVGSDVVMVLTHPGFKIDASLTNVFAVWAAVARKKIYSSAIKRIRTGFVRAAENFAEFRTRF